MNDRAGSTRSRGVSATGREPSGTAALSSAEDAGGKRLGEKRPGEKRSYDVFVSYNRDETPTVERIVRRLRGEGLNPFFDRGIPAGRRWQEDIQITMSRVAACAVFIGREGLGGWAREELAVAQLRAAEDPRFRLFMVLLPGAPSPVDPRLAFLSTRTWVDLRPDSGYGSGFEDLVAAITGVPRHPQPASIDGGLCPYRGLEPFDEPHAGLFFGREDDTRRLGEKLSDSRFMAVLGPSGSGKSSVVKAGLIPALRANALPDSAEWTIRTMTPGGRPLAGLAALLADVAPGDSMQRTLDGLAADERTVDLAVELVLRHGAKSHRFVLVVDQLEEIFTLCRDEDERAAFLSNLIYAATIPGGRAIVVVTLRADFYDRCAPYASVRSALALQHMLIGPLDDEGLRRAIEKPAWAVGLTLEPGLVDTIMSDVGARPGTLPLLEHVLLQIWERRRQGLLTLEAYVESGGVHGALAKHADAVYERLSEAQRDVTERVLLRLVQPGEGTEDARRRVEVEELLTAGDEPAGVEAVLRTLADERLLTTSRDELSEARLVEITHEALLQGWPRLRRWIERDREALLAHRRLTEASREWERSGRDEALLYRGTRLAAWRPSSDEGARSRPKRLTETVEWRTRRDRSLNQLEREFLAASEERAERERTARRRRLRLIFVGLAIALLAITSVAIVAVHQGNQAESQRDIAAHERDLAVSRQLAAGSSSQLSVDPELSVLLASKAMGHAHTTEAEQALERAVADYRPFTVLSGHKGPVFGAAFSPDERWALTAGADGTARLFDAATGRTLAIMRGDGRALNGPAFSPDGQLAVAGGEDGTARVWQVPSGRTVAVLRGHKALVRAPAFSHDGRLVVAASNDGTARVWRARTGRQLSVLKGHKGPVQSAAFSPTARNVVTAGSDGTARVWETATGRSVAVLRGHKDNLLHSASFSSDGRLVVTASRDGTARVWSAATGEQQAVLRGHGAPVGVAAFSPDAKDVVTGGEDGTARIWNAATGDEERVLRGHTAPVGTAIFSRDGRSILTAGEDRSARLWDTETGGQVAVLRGHKDAVLSAALNRDATGVLTSSNDGTARVWHPSPGEAVTVLDGHTDEVGSAAFSPDGRRVVTASFDTTARIWDRSTGKTLLVLRGHSAPVRSAAFSPNGDRIVTASEDGSTRVWDATSGRTVLVLKGHEGKVKSAVFSSDGKRLLTAGADRTARIWDATSGRSLRVLRGHSEEVEAAVFGRHDQLVATASEDNTARLWRAATGKRIATLRGHTDQLEGIAFSGNGRRLVTASSDDTARIWDVATGRTVRVLEGHDGDVESADFSLDSRFVVTASDDKTARVWDAATFRTIVIFRGHETDLESAAFSRDARFIATTSEDRTARIYRCELCVSVDRMLALAHQRVLRKLTRSEKARFHA
jgi:WD40 repeat protein